MTYYLKYLKYKNKYLELKKLIGGAKLDIQIIQKFWKEMKDNEKLYKVLDDNKDIFTEYCWIGSTSSDLYDKGYGFFIYSIDKQQTKNKKLDKFTKVGDYAIKILTKKNLDKVYPYDNLKEKEKEKENKFNFVSKNDISGETTAKDMNCVENIFDDKTCYDVEETVVKIKKGTKCDWFQFEDTNETIFKGWIYNSKPVQYILYKPDN